MSFFSSWLSGLVVLALPLTLSAQFSNTLHPVAQATGLKNSLSSSDFNGDGLPDLLVGADLNVYWVPNAGGSTRFYAPRVISAAGGFAATGDMDGDGAPDVVCTRNYPNSDLAWFRNDGQGAFKLVKTWGGTASFLGYRAVELVDMDGDGRLDILTMVNADAANISWYKNLDGSGTLSNAIPITIAYSSKWMKPLDLDSDGDLDLVCNRSGRTKWFENIDGKGTAWGPEKELDANQSATSAAMADIDGDGLKDLVMTLFGPGLVWYKRNASGFDPLTYLLPGAVSKTGINQFLCVGDPDEDGDTDVICGSPAQLTFYRNNSAGSFQYTVLDTPSTIVGLVLADVDQDGDDDLVAANNNLEKVRWYANTGGTKFGPPQFIHTDFEYVGAMALADMDLDGDLDLIAGNLAPGFVTSTIPPLKQLAWYENQGGHFPRQHIMSFDSVEYARVVVADLDGDNDPDVVASGSNPHRICWFENDGKGGISSIHTVSSNPSSSGGIPEITVADVNVDGYPDIAFLIPSSSGKIFWFKNIGGTGAFGPAKEISSMAYGTGITFLDMNGDQIPDIVASGENFSSARVVWVYFADSIGHYPIFAFNLGTIGQSPSMQTGDLDGDGKKDLAMAGQYGLWICLSKTGFIKKVVDGDLQNSGLDMKITDLDLDGDNDLVVIGRPDVTQRITWYENADGLGNFKPASIIYTNDTDIAYTQLLSCGDLDGDTDPDILFVKGNNRPEFNWLENVIAGSRTISGRCFWDVNANGQPDNNETGLQQLPIQISPLPRATYTGPDGTFRFYVPPGVYQLDFDPGLCQELTTTGSLTANTKNASVDSLYFGVRFNPDSSGLRGWLIAPPTRCNGQLSFRLVLENTGCVSESGTVSLKKSNLASYYNSYPAPETVDADLITWKFQDIPPGNRQEINVIFVMAGASHAGDTVRMQVLPRTTTGGVTITRKPFDFASVITCSHDPNDKQVLPARGGDNRVDDGEELLYTIRFQNTGTDTAFRVVVQDRLSPDLDWSTLRPLAASHPFTTVLNDNGLLEFRFENIVLPDSNANQLESQGFVSYLIRLRAGLPLNTVVGNTADIYFDANPPVITNTVTVKRYDATSATDSPVVSDQSIRLYPNPFSGNLYFQWNNTPDAAPGRLELWDMTGRLSAAVPLPEGQTGALTLPGLQSGFYLYRIVRERDGAALESGKLVKM